jgi:hypothetical protein
MGLVKVHARCDTRDIVGAGNKCCVLLVLVSGKSWQSMIYALRGDALNRHFGSSIHLLRIRFS